MNDVTKHSDLKEVPVKSMDEILDDLSSYGEPWLSKFGSNWKCSVDVFVTGEGVTFKVKSDDCVTPHQACADCHEKLFYALKSIREGKSVTKQID